MSHFLNWNKLEVYNVGNSPTFASSTRQETLTTTFTIGLGRHWVVSDDQSVPDHYIIRLDNNMAHPGVYGDLRNELKLETVPCSEPSASPPLYVY